LSTKSNDTQPSDEENFEKWQILKLQTPINLSTPKKWFDLPSKMSNDKEGLCFDFVVKE
jgi:hypothetical protein